MEERKDFGRRRTEEVYGGVYLCLERFTYMWSKSEILGDLDNDPNVSF